MFARVRSSCVFSPTINKTNRLQWMSSLHVKKGSVNAPEPHKGVQVSVKAYYMARGIDFSAFNTRVKEHMYKNCKMDAQSKSMTITIDEAQHQYVTIFKYGSVVFFNIPEEQYVEHMKQIKEVATVPIAEALQHNEKYKIIIHENLENPSIIKAEHLNIRSLDPNNLTIVSTIMAQTVALDYHAQAVDRMLASFTVINLKVRDTGSFKDLSAQALHKLVASNNTVITNVISELGIFEGTDAAWENADYYNTWEALRKDFEVDQRFKDLSMKVDLIKDDARFFLEVLQNQKSTKLEWIIIILIAGEMVIGLASLGMQYAGV